MITATLHEVVEASSTQDEVHRLAAGGAPHGTGILARCQVQGRGSRGRTWRSPEGGLWLSVLWRPRAGRAAGAGVPLLGVRSGLAVARVIEGLCPGVAVELKWPNDVLVEDRKVGGILCEARWQGDVGWVALGVGLNVHNPVPGPSALRFPAAALGTWCPALDVGRLARALMEVLPALPADPVLGEAELGAWRSRDWLAGRTVRAPVSGTVMGIASTGHLVIRAHATGDHHEVVAGDGFAL